MNRIRKFFSNDNQGEPKVSTAKFTVKFTGPALDDGTMDVRDLAPALLAIGDSCARANHILNGSEAKIKANVNAKFERGSFGFELIISQLIENRETIESFVTNAEEVVKIAGFVVCGTGAVVSGAIGVVKKLKGKKPDKIDHKGGGVVNVTINNYNFDTTEKALTVGVDPKFIQDISKVVSPVNKSGIESFQFGDDDQNPDHRVGKDDLDSFVAPDPKDEEPVIESTHDAVYEIIAPSLQDGYKWRLGGDGGNIMVTIEDQQFLDDIQNGVAAFRSGDLLKVRIRQRVWQNPGGGATREHTIIKVIDHMKRSPLGLPEFPWKNDQEPTE